MTLEKYICIHGHFYQPPRENPWLETIELQDSAYPFHDWNERITAECYAPNTASRILGSDGRIAEIVNNYSKINFNFGPTLLAWLETFAEDVYEAILQADRDSQAIYNGHGSAMAQAYNHMILPLANERDLRTQVYWGVRDFEKRFGRLPEGMWLPETAVDLNSLEALAEHGILFTVLAPYQAHHLRKIGSKEWEDVTGGKIDPTRPYRITLPSGRTMALFFYDGPISQAIAFERLLTDGQNFANRLMNAFSDERDWPQILHIATDGETYGHHHHKGDMALAYAMKLIEENEDVSLINYGLYLEKHPLTHEVEIYENTAWSCSHGIGRWMEDCGCHGGGYPNWNQAWRAPLRNALDWLRDRVAPIYERESQKIFKNPWKARNDYIDVILDRSNDSLETYLRKHARHSQSTANRVTILKLLEMQRHAMLMYTSCGWFFDELSGIETVQVIQYAGRVIQLAKNFTTEDLEEEFLKYLELAKSNIPENKDGRTIYNKFVKPAMVDLHKVAAHYAMSSIFEEYEDFTHIFQFSVDRFDYESFEVGQAKLVVGRAMVTSEITLESDSLSFAVVHLGDHNLYGGIRPYQGDEEYLELTRDIRDAFSKADIATTIRFLDKNFGQLTYSLRELFRDEQRKIIDLIMKNTLETAVTHYRQMYEPNVPMMLFLSELNVPQPKALRTAAEFIHNSELRREFENDHESDDLDFDRIREVLEEIHLWNLRLDEEGLSHLFRGKFERVAESLTRDPDNLDILKRFLSYAELTHELPFYLNLWKVQNVYYSLLKNRYPEFKQNVPASAEAREWVRLFESLGEKLGMVIRQES